MQSTASKIKNQDRYRDEIDDEEYYQLGGLSAGKEEAVESISRINLAEADNDREEQKVDIFRESKD